MQLHAQIRELIAIGASVTANCLACVEFHVARARELGASDEEIGEAVQVGKLVRRGAAGKFDRFAAGVLRPERPTNDPDCQATACSS
jgi:AhpD family alkylhydroperoxidase